MVVNCNKKAARSVMIATKNVAMTHEEIEGGRKKEKRQTGGR